MSLSRDVSNALDILSQQEGAILVRGPDRWFALEPGEPDQYLAINQDGFPSWDTGLVPTEGDTGWQTATLLNGWQDFGAGFPPPAYRRTNADTVLLRGVVKGGSTGLANRILILPEEFNPQYKAQWAEAGDRNLQREEDGSVFLASGSNTFVCLNMVSIIPKTT